MKQADLVRFALIFAFSTPLVFAQNQGSVTEQQPSQQQDQQQSQNQDEPPVAVQPPSDEPPPATQPPNPPAGNPGVPVQPPYIPLQLEVRAGYGAVGAVGTGERNLGFGVQPGTGLAHGADLGVRVLFDGASLAGHWRLNLIVGEEGLNALNVRLRTIRFRYPIDNSRLFWVAVSPLDLDAQATTSTRLRNRFGLRPNALIGLITRLGRSNDSCKLYVFAQAGLELFGFGQTQDNNPLQNFIHPMVGAETMLQCQNVHVDLSYLHLFGMSYLPGDQVFNGVDVNRATADFAAHWRAGPVRLGPYLSTEVSHEVRDPRAALGDSTSGDRLFFQGTAGLRINW